MPGFLRFDRAAPRRVRYAVLGDIHANLEALTAVIKDARVQGCTHYVCVGDVVGYNANPRECLDIVRDVAVACVKGNHDEYCSTGDHLENLSPRAKAVAIWTRQQLTEPEKQWLRDLKYTRLVSNFLLVHSTLDAPQCWGYVFDKLAAAASFSYQNTPVCLFGHTHVPLAFIRDNTVRGGTYSKLKVEPGRKYFINVGSVGEPRDGDLRAAYVIYDFLEGVIELRRIPYDDEKTDAKLRAAGLPQRPKPRAAMPGAASALRTGL